VGRGDTIWEAARRGDVSALAHFLRDGAADVNQLDEWEGTPLYYAALCGHTPAVQFLLERGARCEQDTADGERVHYGALTDGIRTLLRLFQAVNRQRGPLYSWSFRLWDTGKHADVAFQCADSCGDGSGDVVVAHRLILAARCGFFAAQFGPGGRWESKACIRLRNERVKAPALRAVLAALYTDRLVARRGDLHDILPITTALRLTRLRDQVAGLLGGGDRVGYHGHHTAVPDPMELVAVSLSDAYTPGEVPSEGDAACPGSMDLRQAMWHRVVGNYGLLLPDRGTGGDARPQPQLPHDLVVHMGSRAPAPAAGAGASGEDDLGDGDVATFLCHRAVLMQRSPFFVSAVSFNQLRRGGSNSGGEVNPADISGHDDGGVDVPAVVEVHISNVDPATFVTVLEFLYADYVPALPSADHIIAALVAADALIVPDVKPLLVQQALRFLAAETAVPFMRVAEVLSLRRLTTACARFIAQHLDSALADGDFADLVRESAQSLLHRQEFDSVPVLDDVAGGVRWLHPFRGNIFTAAGQRDPAEEAQAAARRDKLGRLVLFAAGLQLRVKFVE